MYNTDSTTDFYILFKRGGYHDFSFKIFCLTVPKISLGNTSVYQKISAIEKFYASQRGRGYHVSPSKTFCDTLPKNFVGEHFRVPENFVYRKNLCIRSFMDEKKRGGGVTRFSVETFLSHSAEKLRIGTL